MQGDLFPPVLVERPQPSVEKSTGLETRMVAIPAGRALLAILTGDGHRITSHKTHEILAVSLNVSIRIVSPVVTVKVERLLKPTDEIDLALDALEIRTNRTPE
jgi:hypothetical protein